MHDPTAVEAGAEDYERALASVVAAFVRDPLLRWFFPDARQYLHYAPLLLKYFAGRAFEHGTAWRTTDFKGAALWLPPGVGPDEQALGAVMVEVVEPTLHEAVFGLLEQVGTGHPQLPHWYLPAIGVDPVCQGRGYGAALLAASLGPIDRDHTAAYLETTNPANIPLYQRAGFEVVGEFQAGSSPVITPMFRAAR
jgi:ribosomal protein S18 acetylase RimI-like enzyme